jgi:hypothetical protein
MMDPLIIALVPVFAAGLAIQQLLEILDPLVIRLVGEKDKKLALGLVSLAAGLVLSFGAGLRVLEPLGMEAGVFDNLITALIISAGTEAFNSLLKFMGYAKENQKGYAATIKAEARRDYVANDIMHRMNRQRGGR